MVVDLELCQRSSVSWAGFPMLRHGVDLYTTRLHATTRPTGHDCIALHCITDTDKTRYRKTRKHSNEHMDEKEDGLSTIKTH
jgi:uncharacterized protein YcgI (DUF1989 family)